MRDAKLRAGGGQVKISSRHSAQKASSIVLRTWNCDIRWLSDELNCAIVLLKHCVLCMLFRVVYAEFVTV